MPELAIGLELVFDGDRCQIVEIQGGAVVLVDSRSRARRVRLIDLLKPAEQGGLAQLPRDSSDDKATDENVLFGVQWTTATPAARAEAHRLAEHIRELETGYRSGSSEIARPDEPRPQYDVGATTIGQRERSKAEELGKHVRTIQNWRRLYRDLGEPGLWDCVFIPEGHSRTFAELGAEKDKISMRRLALDKFAAHLRAERSKR